MNPDDSTYRMQVWTKEYSNRQNLPSTRSMQPSRAVREFLETVNPKNRNTALDLGSGNGRNAFYLAEQGYKMVVGIEYVDYAVNQAAFRAKEKGLEKKVTFIQDTLGTDIESPDHAFDLILDMMVMHCLTKEERDFIVKEINRVIKPGGYLVFYTIAAESEAARKLIEENPGAEENSYRFQVEDDIVTEKAFTKEELRTMFAPLKEVTLEAREEFTPAFGDVYKRMYYYGIFQMPE